MTWGAWNPLADLCATSGERLLGERLCWTVSRWGLARRGGLLDRFDMRGLIIFKVMETLLTLPWILCI